MVVGGSLASLGPLKVSYTPKSSFNCHLSSVI